jgi:hypothetical protein
MVASLFKYLPSQYLDAFVGRGELLFRSLSYFRNYEELEVRGDPQEGQRLYNSLNGLEINNLTSGESINFPWSFESSVQAREIFVFCFSLEYLVSLSHEFDTDVCVEIHNPAALLAKVRAALMLRRWVKNAKLLHGTLNYYSPSEPPLAEWAVPERMVLKKTENFAGQREYRFAFARGNALQLNNVVTQITATPGVSQPTLIGHPEHVLRIGNLAKLCTIHTLNGRHH